MAVSLPSPTTVRVGLALSGGGFRASLFHLGVLARLAELDRLRELQVISTVSGGSIIGALYYLHVRRLLQSKHDDSISRDDYIDLVNRMWREFTEAIGHNLRMQTFGDWKKTLRTLYDRQYSRSDRMAELYDGYLYAGPAGATPSDGLVQLPALTIEPFGERGFKPFRQEADGNTSNDRRRNKVPVLVLNATTLNTGHSFQFSATWMGEPPAIRHHGDVDRNLRLRRAYYTGDRLPDKYQTLPLAIAVAASAAVPGIFPPLALTDLYRDGTAEITPKLVDGGVHDNQGIGGLLIREHPCTHLIVSDASGQMADVPRPNGAIAAVLKRCNDALMDRVREEQHAVGSLLGTNGHTMSFFHLKQCLPQRELTWIGGSDKANQVLENGGRTPYGVDSRVQQLLAGIRTDLDAFTEVESYALMADGYLIARHCLDAEEFGSSPVTTDAVEHDWEFLRIQPYLEDPSRDPSLTAQLEAGGRLFGKSLRTVESLRWLTAPATLLGIIAVLTTFALAWTFPGVCLAVFLYLAIPALLRSLAQAWGWRRVETVARVLQVIFPGALAPLLALLVRRHLRTLTPMRLEAGRVDRLRPCGPPTGRREAA